MYLLFLSIILIVHSGEAKDCIISLEKDLRDPQPLLLTKSGGVGYEAFLPPTTGREVHISDGTIISIACPRGSLKLDGTMTHTDVEDAICKGDKTFNIKGIDYNFKDIICNNSEDSAVYTGEKCLNDYKEVKIGFELSDGRFLVLMFVCFDEVKQNTLYSYYNLTSNIEYHQINYPSIDFDESIFYHLAGETLKHLYSRNKQRETINGLLGLQKNSYKYITKTSDYYLAKGHLTAKTDFIYGSQQTATFYFINVAPQWQTLNAGNWKSLEACLRKFSSNKELNLEVYTGTYETATLPHAETGEDIKLYLYIGEDGKTGIPVPQYYWKVVYDRKNLAGVAMISINNPYQESYTPICPDICDLIKSWLTWKPDNKKSGFSYCCDVNEFRKVVPYLPDFEVKHILKSPIDFDMEIIAHETTVTLTDFPILSN